eukprot:CAMPEP_0202972412 /NCGR_PEP_ID=MMETSP1396-20130829/36386_1 /ASSEMBLY_ACC=CAM_ASM_000872 /TAXON_ID= /ORGANISM="Pseudokeronopsis sp., Strain Brazil" /LENGTH=35 /DNA_ID= /DNA_START= /DNA_END= /DNA_ORIENTATION=
MIGGMDVEEERGMMPKAFKHVFEIAGSSSHKQYLV